MALRSPNCLTAQNIATKTMIVPVLSLTKLKLHVTFTNGALKLLLLGLMI
jgi:hypothetical protein